MVSKRDKKRRRRLSEALRAPVEVHRRPRVVQMPRATLTLPKGPLLPPSHRASPALTPNNTIGMVMDERPNKAARNRNLFRLPAYLSSLHSHTNTHTLPHRNLLPAQIRRRQGRWRRPWQSVLAYKTSDWERSLVRHRDELQAS